MQLDQSSLAVCMIPDHDTTSQCLRSVARLSRKRNISAEDTEMVAIDLSSINYIFLVGALSMTVFLDVTKASELVSLESAN